MEIPSVAGREESLSPKDLGGALHRKEGTPEGLLKPEHGRQKHSQTKWTPAPPGSSKFGLMVEAKLLTCLMWF